MTKELIIDLGLDEKMVGLKLLDKNWNPETLIWILNILEEQMEEVEEFTKSYIRKKSEDSHIGLIIKCLNILDNTLEEVQEFAIKYIKQDVRNIHADLILKCINILGNDSNEVQNFVIKYINEDIEHITPSLMIKSLDILEQEVDKINSFSKEYIELVIKEDFSNFDNGLVIKCLNILDDEHKELQKEFSQKYIQKNTKLSTLKNIEIKLVIKCLDTLDDTLEEVKLFSKKYIQEDIRKNNKLVIQCLETLGKNSEEVQSFSKKYLEQEKVNMRIFLECLSILDINLDEVEVFNSIQIDNNLIQKYMNIFLRYDIKKYKSDFNKISFSKYFKLLAISPKDLYVMLYHEHKIYMFNKNLGDYARYCNKHKDSEVKLRGISEEKIYQLYHYRASLLFEIMGDFYFKNKELNYPKNILPNILKSIDKKRIYKKEIENLFFNEINNKNSDMREKSIVDLANYYNDIIENEKAIKTIALGIKIDLIESDMFINYAQNALINALCKSYQIRKIMGSKYNKNTYKMKQLLKNEKRKR